MKIAIPTSDGRLDPHFGHCKTFTFFSIDSASGKVAHVEAVSTPQHEHGLLPTWLNEQHASVVIAGGMGTHAQTLLKGFAIEVITGAPSDPPHLLVEQYLTGQLQSVERTCNHTCNH